MSQQRRRTQIHIPEHLRLSQGGDDIRPEKSEATVDPVGVLSRLLSLRPLAPNPDAFCTRAVASPKKDKMTKTRLPNSHSTLKQQ